MCFKETLSIFFNETSYIETKPLNTSNSFTLSFQTCAGGTLLRQNGSNNDYLELSLAPGTYNYTSGIYIPSTLTLTWRIANIENSVRIGQDLDNNLRYNVIYAPGSKHQNTTSTLSVSMNNVHARATMTHVNVPNTVLDMVTRGNLILGHGFIGCISFGGMLKSMYAIRNVSISEICPLVENQACKRSGKPFVLLGPNKSWSIAVVTDRPLIIKTTLKSSIK